MNIVLFDKFIIYKSNYNKSIINKNYKMGPTGFEPVIFSTSKRRLNRWTMGPNYLKSTIFERQASEGN